MKSTESPRAGVQWDPPADDGGSRSFKGYKLEVSVGTGEERNWVVLLDRYLWTTFLDPLAEPGQTRTYRVRARNSVDEGPPSEEVTILVPAIEAGTPRDLAVTLDGPKFKLAWRAPGNNGGAEITGYKIEASTDQEEWVADPDTVTTLHHSLSGLNLWTHLLFPGLGDQLGGHRRSVRNGERAGVVRHLVRDRNCGESRLGYGLGRLFVVGRLLRLDPDAEHFHL